MRRARRLGLALLGFVLATLPAAPAYADGMGLKGLGEFLWLAIGVVALALGALLGALSWFKVFRPPQTTAGVLGRGFVGVSAVVAFSIGVIGVVVGFDLETPWALGALAVMVVFMAAEFYIAAILYFRVHRARGSGMARFLAFASCAIGGLFVLGALLIGGVGLLTALDPDPAGPNGEVRGYQKGCAANDGSDCNMLGLRYEYGEGGLKRDATRAAESFRKACDLGTAIGCRNLADLYDDGKGVPRNAKLAKQYRDRYKELERARHK